MRWARQETSDENNTINNCARRQISPMINNNNIAVVFIIRRRKQKKKKTHICISSIRRLFTRNVCASAATFGNRWGVVVTSGFQNNSVRPILSENHYGALYKHCSPPPSRTACNELITFITYYRVPKPRKFRWKTCLKYKTTEYYKIPFRK